MGRLQPLDQISLRLRHICFAAEDVSFCFYLEESDALIRRKLLPDSINMGLGISNNGRCICSQGSGFRGCSGAGTGSKQQKQQQHKWVLFDHREIDLKSSEGKITLLMTGIKL
jgi:hypothetical protein